MPKLNFLFVPWHNTGGHFLLWSIDFLSGQHNYFSGDRVTPVIPADKLLESKNNSHNHQVHHVHGYQKFIEFLPKIDNIDVSYVNIWASPISKLDLAIQKHNISLLDLSIEARQELDTEQLSDAARLLNLAQKKYNLVFVDYHSSDYLNIIYNDRFPIDVNNNHVDSPDQIWTTYKNLFYKGIDETFSDDYIWDQREKLALMIPPMPINDYYQLVDKSLPHLYYTTDDIWNDLPNVILEIIDFLGLTLDHSNQREWTEAYNHWRQLHDNFFSRNFNKIVDAIVNGNYMSLKRYQLNFFQEALIQRELIIKHNLNLKTWKLEKFPDNTLDIHYLLEPNIHHL